MAKRKKRRRREFSKTMIIVATTMVAFVVAFAFIIMWRAESTEGIEYVAVGSFAFLTLAYRRYYAKAEQENQIKLRQIYGEDYITLDRVAKGDNDE